MDQLDPKKFFENVYEAVQDDQKKKRSASRKIPSRLLTMYKLYNQKPPSLPKKNGKAILIR